MPASYQTGFEEADGTKIPKEEWFIPNPSLLPPPLSGEAKEQAREMMEHNPEVFEHKKEELKRAWENPGE
jgi:hypothetical protein